MFLSPFWQHSEVCSVIHQEASPGSQVSDDLLAGSAWFLSVCSSTFWSSSTVSRLDGWSDDQISWRVRLRRNAVYDRYFLFPLDGKYKE